MTEAAEKIGEVGGIEYGDEREFTCQSHGAYRGRPYRLTIFGTVGAERAPECPGCRAAADEKRKADELAKAEVAARAKSERRFILAGIPQRFRPATLENYQIETDGQRRAHAVVTRYVERFEHRRKVGGSLIFVGKPGTGKTHLLCAIAASLPDRWAVKYTDCWSMVSEVKATFRRSSGEDEDSVIDRFVKPDLLLVDEVGVQYGSDTERAIIHRVLDLRYQAVKPTIVSGNVDLDGMNQYLGERAVSRLHECGGMVLVFDWLDHRRRIGG